MRSVFLIVILSFIVGCVTTVEVAKENRGITKVAENNYLLEMTISGARNDKKIDAEIETFARGLCMGEKFEYAFNGQSAGPSWGTMVNNVYVENHSIIRTYEIKCSDSKSDQYILVAKGGEIKVPEGFVKLTIFNSTNDTFYSGSTGDIYVEFNGKELVKLPKKKYAEFFVKEGKYQIDVSHIDLKKFTGQEVAHLEKGEYFISVSASLFSTKIKLRDILPANFEIKYKPYLSLQ